MMKKAVLLLLICVSSGWLFANHWTPNDSEYEDNMTLTGVIQIDGVEQQSTALEVGVFCGEECRGSGYPTYFFPAQRYVIQLLVFGESGDSLTFKLFDSDSGQELNLVSPDAVTFNANGYGSLYDPLILNFTGNVPVNYTISASANPEVGGTIEGVGDYQEGQTCTLVATANEGYAFSNWTENGAVVSTHSAYAFSVTSDRALIANFIVAGNNTHWIPNKSDYEDNMTLIGVIQINGVEQQSTTLEVGVFCGEECRGTGLASYFFPTQCYVVQLLIFGETGDQLTFKLYDHALGHELNLTPPDAVTFNANGYGSLGSPYMLNFTGEIEEITQTIALSAGWNWFSTSLDINLDQLKAVLVTALPNTNISIKSQTQNTSYNPNNNRWVGSLAWDVSKMYMISVTAACEITLIGMPINPSEHSISIMNGANWIGFPHNSSMSLANAFAGFAVNGDRIKSQTNNALYNGIRWQGQLNALESGKGYIYISNSLEERTLTFPTIAK